MIKLDKKLTPDKYPKEAAELNKMVIKLKKEILKGTITSISVDEIDDATIPALNILWGQKYKE